MSAFLIGHMLTLTQLPQFWGINDKENWHPLSLSDFPQVCVLWNTKCTQLTTRGSQVEGANSKEIRMKAMLSNFSLPPVKSYPDLSSLFNVSRENPPTRKWEKTKSTVWWLPFLTCPYLSSLHISLPSEWSNEVNVCFFTNRGCVKKRTDGEMTSPSQITLFPHSWICFSSVNKFTSLAHFLMLQLTLHLQVALWQNFLWPSPGSPKMFWFLVFSGGDSEPLPTHPTVPCLLDSVISGNNFNVFTGSLLLSGWDSRYWIFHMIWDKCNEKTFVFHILLWQFLDPKESDWQWNS